MDSQFTHLLSPIRIGPIEIRNRLVSSAHGTSFAHDYAPTLQHVAYHSARAQGGIGLIIMEGARVHPSSRPVRASLVSWDEKAIPHYRKVADAIHRHGSKVFVQLLHQGKAVNTQDSNLPLWSASATLGSALGSARKELAHAMSKEEIQEVIASFVQGALNMKRAGMDGVEIHGAHGYLVQDFLSPLTNHRNDEYGGNQHKRTRFALELGRSIREAVGHDFAVGIRLSADEFTPGGLTLKETTKVAQWLEESGDLDFLNITHSNTDPLSFAMQQADMSWPQAPFVHLPNEIKNATRGIPVFAVCRIIDPHVAENIIATGKADMVCMTRAHIADPEIGRKLMEGRPYDIRQCIGSTEGCSGRSHRGKPIGCVTNPEAGREYELGPLRKSSTPQAIAVVGGGPAGLEAARVAAMRGHKVALFEKSARLGGQVNTLVKAPHRQESGNIIAWLEYQLRNLAVIVKLNTEATLDILEQEGAQTIIVATGSTPQLPEIPGARDINSCPVVSAEDVLEGSVPVGNRVLMLDSDSHHKAASVAEFMSDRSAQVYLVTRSDSVAADISIASRPPAIQRLKERHVIFQRDSWIKSIQGHNIVLEDIYNYDQSIIADIDLVVVAGSNQPRTVLLDTLKLDGRFPNVVPAGDCVSPRHILEAIREGHMVGRNL
jgi:2,4-dienoyl-CoA reductase-like NADH-dependent reductase (Old Yellow Enzyme family)/thioredoxin reductase